MSINALKASKGKSVSLMVFKWYQGRTHANSAACRIKLEEGMLTLILKSLFTAVMNVAFRDLTITLFLRNIMLCRVGTVCFYPFAIMFFLFVLFLFRLRTSASRVDTVWLCLTCPTLENSISLDPMPRRQLIGSSLLMSTRSQVRVKKKERKIDRIKKKAATWIELWKRCQQARNNSLVHRTSKYQYVMCLVCC